MADRYFVKLDLLTVEREQAIAPGTLVTLERSFANGSGAHLIDRFNLDFPPARRVALENPSAFGAIQVRIETERWRPYISPALLPFPGKTGSVPAELLRKPLAWRAEFVRWDDLGGRFDQLKEILDASDSASLLVGDRMFEPIGPLGPAGYDSIGNGGPKDLRTLAKASLLNLYWKLSAVVDPTDETPWIDYVRRVLVVGRERFIALARPKLAESVRRIRDDISRFGDVYKPAPSDLHDDWPAGFRVDEKFSVKTHEDLGNLQLTVAVARDEATGDQAILLDVDIDENGEFFAHLADVLIRHKITGGTHPFDIHEIFTHQSAGDLGYGLV
jgi:hypothetical protein